jgi:hypothetical protein
VTATALQPLDRTLEHLDQAKRALLAATSIDDVRDIRDKAAAIERYMRQRDDSREAQNAAAELKLRAERRLGELLAKTEERAKKGRPGTKMLHDATFSGAPPKLAELGIERTQSHRWQKLACVPEEQFENFISETKNAGGEITTAAAMRMAPQSQRAAEPKAPSPKAFDDLEEGRRLLSRLGDEFARWPAEHWREFARVAKHFVNDVDRWIEEQGL